MSAAATTQPLHQAAVALCQHLGRDVPWIRRVVMDPSVIMPSDPARFYSRSQWDREEATGTPRETHQDEGIPSIIVIEGSSIIVIALTVAPGDGVRRPPASFAFS